VITVVDKRALAVPTGLTAIPQTGELLINWQQNRERDLIGFGLENDPNKFVYTRNMGPKEIITDTSNLVDAKLWGLTDNTTIFYGLRAYDISGNVSDWTPLQAAKPWALGPSGWNPVPSGEGSGAVEIAFDTPLKQETLDGALTVVDASGNPVAGELYLISDFDSTPQLEIHPRTIGAIDLRPTPWRQPRARE
jgi:hypothetical protein